MGGSGRHMRRNLALVGAGLALLGSGCARTDGAETAASATAESPPPLEAAELFGATDPSMDASAPGMAPAPPLLFDPAQTPERGAPPPTAAPLADL